MNKLFIFLCVLHIIIWAFVLFAWINNVTAYINLYIVIPFIYILHILPFHIIVKSKQQIYGDTYKDKETKVNKYFILPVIYNSLKSFFNMSTFNPLSPQGMLILGAITSAYKII